MSYTGSHSQQLQHKLFSNRLVFPRLELPNPAPGHWHSSLPQEVAAVVTKLPVYFSLSCGKSGYFKLSTFPEVSVYLNVYQIKIKAAEPLELKGKLEGPTSQVPQTEKFKCRQKASDILFIFEACGI